MTTPRYTITRARARGPLPWKLTRTGDGPDRVSRHWTHADAVAAMDRMPPGIVPLPQALLAGRAYGHTLVVTEDPAAARRRALKARRMAARRRARRSAPPLRLGVHAGPAGVPGGRLRVHGPVREGVHPCGFHAGRAQQRGAVSRGAVRRHP